MHIVDRLSMLRNKHSGMIQQMVTAIIVNVLESNWCMMNSLSPFKNAKSKCYQNTLANPIGLYQLILPG